MMQVIYIKGGDVVREAQLLFPRAGEILDGGPDKFLLSVLASTLKARFRLIGIGATNECVELNGRQVQQYGMYPAGGKLRRRLAYLRNVLQFFRDTVKFKPTKILCGREGLIGVVALCAARISKAEFIFLAHCALDTDALSTLSRKANKFLCIRADRIIAHGPFLFDQCLKLGAERKKIIEWNNGLDDADARLLKAGSVPTGPIQTILYLGRMEVQKGIFDLAEAFLALGSAANVRLKYIGGGSAITELKKLIEDRGAAQRVEILGPIPFESVFSHLKSAQIVVTPTHAAFPEGLCQSAIEAFYAGKPVIAPDYGPFPYIIKNEINGLLYKSDSVEDLTATLRRYLADAELQSRMAIGAEQAGKEFLVPETTFDQAIRKILS